MEDKKFLYTEEVFVLIQYGEYEIKKIFTDKSFAELECTILNKNISLNPYKVMTLNNAINLILGQLYKK